MSNHDHLDPLPEATPRLIVGVFVGGVVTINTIRVRAFGDTSMLTGIDL